METTSYKLFGHFVTMELLSHIGESESTRSFLNEVPVKVKQADGSYDFPRVFQYNGNAWRGQLRDAAADYMMHHLSISGAELRAFNMLYSGGAFTEGTSVQVGKIRNMRSLIPMLAVFSSGETRDSKMRVNSVKPVCEEMADYLLHTDSSDYAGISYRQLHTEISHTRRDDAKDPRKNTVIRNADLMLDGGDVKAKKQNVSTQMRTTFEALAIGTMLETTIRLSDVSEIELGCLTSALVEFGKSPKIGGKVASGFGEVSLTYDITNLNTGETRPFIRIGNGRTDMEPEAVRALEAYSAHLTDVYEASLNQNSGSIRALLAGVG